MHLGPRPPNNLRFIDVQAGVPWQARPIHVSRRRHESSLPPAHFRESPNPGRGVPAMVTLQFAPLARIPDDRFFAILLDNHDKGDRSSY